MNKVVGGLLIMVFLVAFLVVGPLVQRMSNEYRMWIFRVKVTITSEIILSFLSVYIWKSIIPLIDGINISDSVWINSSLKAVLVIFLVSAQSSIFTIVFRSGYWICTYCFCCLGIYLQYATSYFFANMLVYVWQFLKRTNVHPKHQFHLHTATKRRSFATVYIATIYAISISSCGLYNASLPPIVKRVDIAVKGFPSFMDGFNILLLSDIHFGGTVSKVHVDRIFDIIDGLEVEPDVLALVGDLADETAAESGNGIKPLKHLRSRYGKYFVTGNHDYYTGDVENWFKHLEMQLGFIVLHNSHVVIKNDTNDLFYLAGIDDYEARQISYGDHAMNLEKAVGLCDMKIPIILLAHQPRAAKEALDSNYNIKLVLSGHTHGGQMMPETVLQYFTNPFFAGLYSYKSGQVYVTEGTVFYGVPMRMFSRSEITNIFIYGA